ncbi:MAG: restriction endonuclease [Armatimonadetes bacterium]|nr:restriction endonuclease [Armatimonadota bacterium]
MTDAEVIAEKFLSLLQAEADTFESLLSTSSGDWIVKGFIDIFRRVYTISGDTKVVSKLIELMLLPHFNEFAKKHNMELVLAREQNHYPDMSFVTYNSYKFAVDLKSTYRINSNLANTMTLGAFTGYFRNRSIASNTTFPYADYAGHFVLGVIYDRPEQKVDELKIHTIRELEIATALKDKQFTITALEEIPSVVKNLSFFAQPKYRIARDQPGSGNTKNIGAVGSISQLTNGTGPFAALGEEVFDDYWRYYMTIGDAKAAGLERPPYRNLQTYLEYKKVPNNE